MYLEELITEETLWVVLQMKSPSTEQDTMQQIRQQLLKKLSPCIWQQVITIS